MFSSSDSRIASDRFARYVAELREFSSSHDLAFGSPQQLPLLLDRLNQSSDFRDECTSMLRSIFYREHGNVPPEDLLLLLIIAWADHPTAPPSPALESTITDLLRFAAGIMRVPTGPARQPETSIPPLPPGQVHDEPVTLGKVEVENEDEEKDEPHPELTPPPSLNHSPAILQHETAALDKIESDLQLLAIRSPDVKRYLHLLKDREHQRLLDQHLVARRHKGPEENGARPPAPSLPTWQPSQKSAHTPSAPIIVYKPEVSPREDPWDPNSEFQIELRRFAAHREAERQAHLAAAQARHQQRPASAKLADVAESAWNRLLHRPHREP